MSALITWRIYRSNYQLLTTSFIGYGFVAGSEKPVLIRSVAEGKVQCS